MSKQKRITKLNNSFFKIWGPQLVLHCSIEPEDRIFYTKADYRDSAADYRDSAACSTLGAKHITQTRLLGQSVVRGSAAQEDVKRLTFLWNQNDVAWPRPCVLTMQREGREIDPLTESCRAGVTFTLLAHKPNYKIIRPLLNCSRSLLTTLCIRAKVPVYPDKSNVKIEYARNRLRKQIIPSITFFLNPEIENSIFTFSELMIKQQFLNSFMR